MCSQESDKSPINKSFSPPSKQSPKQSPKRPIKKTTEPSSFNKPETLGQKLEIIPCPDCKTSIEIKYYAELFTKKEELGNWYDKKYHAANPCAHLSKHIAKSDELYRKNNLKIRSDDRDENKMIFRTVIADLEYQLKIRTKSKITETQLSYTQIDDTAVDFVKINRKLENYSWWRDFVEVNKNVQNMGARCIEKLLKSERVISW